MSAVTATQGPRINKTGRRQTTKTVDGVRLIRQHGDWAVDGTPFVFQYDEHNRAWWLINTDTEIWWGATDDGVPRVCHSTLVGSLARGVKALRELG